MPAPFDPHSLTRIGRYPVVRFLAEGGMSWVFEVRDPDLFDARRALKLIKPHVLAEHEMLARFEDEVRLLARIEHPNLVRVYEYGSDASAGARFFTMEFIEGPHLGEVVAEYLIEPGATTTGVAVAAIPQIVGYFLGILSALARVHEKGVFHRDIKPENIMVTQDGVAKLADFSIARDTRKAGVTRAGLVPGTPKYMSPEQSLDEPVGAASDLFSLGLTLYRVLTGRSIYATELGDETKTQQVIRHLWELYTRKRDFRFEFPQEVPPALQEVVRRACRIDPKARYASALEMREALAAALAPPRAGDPNAERDPDADVSRGRVRRRLMSAVAGVAAVGVLGGIAAVYVGSLRRGALAEELLERTRLRSRQATELVRWLGAREDAAARALASRASADLRRFDDDLDQAAVDVKDGFAELALRELGRAEQGFTALCDRFAGEYLESSLSSAEGFARDACARVTEEVRSLVPEPAAELDRRLETLSAAIGTRGCARAEDLRVRIEAAASLRSLAGTALRSADQALPVTADRQIELAETARMKAHAPAVANELYLERLREGDEALSRARAERGARDFRSALGSARVATQHLERAALLGGALRARAQAERLVQQLDAIDVPLGATRPVFESAQRSFGDGDWQRAASGFTALTPELAARLEAAAPVVEAARLQATACERAADSGGLVAEIRDSELNARAMFRAAKFDEAKGLYADLESRCRQIAAAAAKRAARARELARTESEKLDLQARQRRAAEAARTRVDDSISRLAAAQVGTTSLAPEVEAAKGLLESGGFDASERAYGTIEARLKEFASDAKSVVAMREQVQKEFRSARTSGIAESELSAGNALRDSGEKRLAEGDLDAAREKLGAALASYREVRSAAQAREGAALEAREKELEARRVASAAADRDLAQQRAAASVPRDQLARGVSELRAKGLPLGAVAEARDAAEASYTAKRYDEAAVAFARANALAGEQLQAGRPILDARSEAQAARERALGRGASGPPLSGAAKRYDEAAAALANGKLPAALEGFRAAAAAYDSVESDPAELVKLLFSNWDLAWSERDIALLRRTQSLSSAQEQGFAKIFQENDEISQRTRVLGISRVGPEAWEVRVEYVRTLKIGAAEKRQDAQKRVARVERSGASWIIATVTQK